jgi:hypothetical protein
MDGWAVEDECASAASSSGLAKTSARSCFLRGYQYIFFFSPPLVGQAATLQTIYLLVFLEATARQDLESVAHTPPHEFGPARSTADLQRPLQKCRTLPVAAKAGEEVGVAGSRQAYYDD